VTRKKRRLTLIAAAGAVLVLSATLVLFALRDQIVFFYSPTEIAEIAIEPGTRLRIGGLVVEGSIDRDSAGSVKFAVTDTVNTIEVVYDNQLPDLFREGQGIVAEGVLTATGLVTATNVLAKHDENYMPSAYAGRMRGSSRWRRAQRWWPLPASPSPSRR
jgi:cytochrome c-type biogenesis protein CcmE